MKVKTMIVIDNTPEWPNQKRPKDLFSAEEIDHFNYVMLEGKDREKLLAIKQKLADTFDWLDSGDCEIGSPQMQEWEKRLDRLNDMMDKIDEILYPEEETDDEDW